MKRLLVVPAALSILCLSASPAAPAEGAFSAGLARGAQVAREFWTLPKLSVPKKGAYFGAYVHDAPFKMQDLTDFTARAGRKPALLMWFQPWGYRGRYIFYASQMSQLREQGIVPVISWEPWNPPPDPRTLKDPAVDPVYRLRNITRGDFDYYIKGWARDAKEYGAPMILRPLHEMNGNWYPWSPSANGNRPGDFIPAWRHIHDIFIEEGATNVSWVWSVNENSVPNTPENSFENLYPGDEYVDWVGVSSFNWGPTLGRSTFRSFAQIYDPQYERLAKFGKPILITEISSVEEGGDKAAWINETFKQIHTYPQIHGFIWFNNLDQKRDFRIDSSAAALAAFKAAIAEDRFIAAPAPHAEP